MVNQSGKAGGMTGQNGITNRSVIQSQNGIVGVSVGPTYITSDVMIVEGVTSYYLDLGDCCNMCGHSLKICTPIGYVLQKYLTLLGYVLQQFYV
ncbi:uncharacterized protein [Rutidosis leptorrhynchoides]|uniref:uncharacterized protein isoform X3 n=1 Tax=Rutidosis leptorrhynchoides TaxID=125765 RepID=UPI003A9A2B32